jgi:hypothetical protein
MNDDETYFEVGEQRVQMEGVEIEVPDYWLRANEEERAEYDKICQAAANTPEMAVTTADQVTGLMRRIQKRVEDDDEMVAGLFHKYGRRGR